MLGHHGRIVATDASGYARPHADEGTLLPPQERIAMRRTTIFDLASVSKSFTSILAVQLLELEQLSLEARSPLTAGLRSQR